MKPNSSRNLCYPPLSSTPLSQAANVRDTLPLSWSLRPLGICSYEPDEESIHAEPTTGDSAEDRDGQSQASASASSRGGGGGASGNGNGSGSGSGSGNADGEPPAPVPCDPPTGTWSVRFPSFQAKSIFLHRTSIRELRRSLATPSQGDGGGGEKNPNKMTMLPVFLERRELQPEPAADEGKAGGKGAKKGGGKKPAAGKKGEVTEPPPQPRETPWRCHAEIDLLPLVQPAAVVNGSPHGEDKEKSTLSAAGGNIVDPSKAGDSPLRAELRAALTLAPPSAEDAALNAANAEGLQGEDTTPRASVAAPAAKGGEIEVNKKIGTDCVYLHPGVDVERGMGTKLNISHCLLPYCTTVGVR